MKYIVGVADLFENTNELKIVEASGPLLALFAAVEQEPIDYNNGIETVQEFIDELFSQEQLISAPIAITGLVEDIVEDD